MIFLTLNSTTQFICSQQIYNKFRPLIDSNDTLWIITLKRPYFGQGSQGVIDWLDASLAH